MLVLPANAKVNLGLEVVARRPDGWHEIDTLIVPIDWHDLIGLRLAPGGIRLRVTGPSASGLPGTPGAASADQNLAVRAISALLAGVDRRPASGVDVWLDKRVPAAAGLGGGSADAAAALHGVRRLFATAGVSVDDELIREVAQRTGSDVLALLESRPVQVKGRGDLILPLDVPSLHLVIVWLEPMSTATVYAALQPDECSSHGRIDRLIGALRERKPLDEMLGSALERAAVRANAALGEAASRLRALDPNRAWHMTGSGGAYFTLCDDAQAAQSLAARLQRAGFMARACRTAGR